MKMGEAQADPERFQRWAPGRSWDIDQTPGPVGLPMPSDSAEPAHAVMSDGQDGSRTG